MRPKRKPLVVPREPWNRFVGGFLRNRLRRVTVLDPIPWRHPWWTSPTWWQEGKQWVAAVVPGWCESHDGDPEVIIETLPGLVELPGGTTVPPDSEWPYGLTSGPRIRIPNTLWRALGTDAVGSREVLPPELIRAGVMPPPQLVETEGGLATAFEGVVKDRAMARLARAVEVVLKKGREVVVLSPNTGEDGLPELSMNFLTFYEDPGIELRSEWPEGGPVSGEFIPLDDSGIFADEGIDELRLATIYLISEPGAPEGSEVDGSWSPLVRHHVKRNVAYEVLGPAGRVLEPLRFPWLGQTLAGGAGAELINRLAGELRNRAAELDAILGQFKTRGRFVEF
jgi:hypothetical protein